MKVNGSDTVLNSQLRMQRINQCQGRLCVRRNGQTAKTRQFVVLSGFGPDHNLGVYNNNVDTVERSMTERYFLCQEKEDQFRPAYSVRPSAFKGDGFDEFRESVIKAMPKLPRMSRSATVASYRGPKQKVYANAQISLEETPIDVKDSRLNSFTKFEKVDVGKAPRGINPRSARYNLELARFLKHAEHHFFNAINKVFGARTKATVIKGFNADVSAGIIADKMAVFKNPVAIGLDAKKFDMHVSTRALKYEHSFYRKLFPRCSKLLRLLKWQLVNKGTAYTVDGSVVFEMKGTRSSGDINTSLGNCILMCAMVFAYCKMLGIDCELANNGDDCVVFMEREDETKFRASLPGWFRKRGFAMTVEKSVSEVEEIEFCQTHPVLLSTGWRMVRNLKAVMEKDPICLLPINGPKVLQKWLHAVGTCGGILSSGVPVLSDFYKSMLRHGVDSKGLINEVYKGRSQLALGKGCAVGEITPSARVSFYYAFGVTPDHQIALEDHYKSLQLDLQIQEAVDREHLLLNPGNNILTQSN